jgi:hypothetical protein
MTARPKFLRHYGPLQLRVEQIGPDLWVGLIYLGAWPGWWDPFTALTEEAAKRGALATAFNRFGPAPEGSDDYWRSLSDIPDADWAITLASLGFPGYPAREGMQRWDGF